MTQPPDPANRPRPELLAGYADGELPGPQRRAVEAWLIGDPAAERAAVRHCCLARRLRGLFRRTAPPPPCPLAWAGVLTGIAASLERANPVTPTPARTGHFPGRSALLGVVAASVAVLIGGPEWRRPLAVLPSDTPAAPAITAADGFLVMNNVDVDILSLRPADATILLVGVSPLPEALEFAAAGDVTVHSVQPGPDGTRPEMADDGMPMLVAPAPRDP
jgi:hypothetical protein